ncbi:hypothetical protein LEP1GSC058_2021 [Leptospira fainei serovar Hurstbridge str. BUT 6]|uniref:Uncharacterized protein n=1 Tax=Leptospira fainei serovar Hurstbridge str. BUT 6 TaxID=1193011 RepID=S3W510_9LEPT|nr:hypothetical protein LEP1GSC058_2021 [Leptospira fainei serovar Hurstbridge str. BUT 6]
MFDFHIDTGQFMTHLILYSYSIPNVHSARSNFIKDELKISMHVRDSMLQSFCVLHLSISRFPF